MLNKRIVFAGFGGQGILMMGQILAYGAMLEGKEVTFMPSYGPEMRGGTANCTVVISETPIASPITCDIDILVAMNGSSLEKFQDSVVPGGTIFVNSGMVTGKIERQDVEAFYVNGMKMANDLFQNEKVANVVLLGAVLHETQLIPLDHMESVFKKTLKGKKSELIQLNVEAVKAWGSQ